MSWFTKPLPPADPFDCSPVPQKDKQDEGIPRYVLTDEGLQALVQGKLSCTKISDGRVKASGKFLVEYDSIVFTPASARMEFCWKGTVVMKLDLPIVKGDNTLTVNGLQGKLTLEISV